MTKRAIGFLLAAFFFSTPVFALDDASVPPKFNIPWGNSAGAPTYIRPIPQPSQIGIQNCAASLTDGFPPLTFTQVAAGGCAPFGQDFNGILKQITQWNRWQAAGGPIVYDSTFQAGIGGYPKGAIIQTAASVRCFWISAVDNNASNPDTGGANWTSTCAPPTYQSKFTGSGTLTPSPNVTRWKVRMCAGGGAGATPSLNGSAGATTSLGSWTVLGGGGGFSNGNQGPGGTGGANGTGTLIERSTGGNGQQGFVVQVSAGTVAVQSFAVGGTNQCGGFQASNSGSGGASSGATSLGSTVTGPGAGGAGEYVEFVVPAPTATAYSIGTGGNNTAGAGLNGALYVEEFYN